jgi:hypothetical protein
MRLVWVDWLADTDARRREEEQQIRAAQAIARERRTATTTLWSPQRRRDGVPRDDLERTA